MTFDLERARGLRDFLQDDCAEVGDVWAEMIAEIERLREALDKSEQILAHKTKTSTHWYEEGLQTRADLVQSKRVVEQQAARIEELEDVHKRSGVKYAKIINELRSSVYANMPGLKKQWDEILNTPANDKIGPSEEQIRAKMAELPSTPGPYRPAIREEAIRQLDVKPQVWQITEERRDAIMKMSSIRTIIFCPDCGASMEFIDIVEPMAVLRGMLEEVA